MKYLPQFFSGWEMFQNEKKFETINHSYMLSNFFPDNRAVRADGPQMTV